MNLDALYAHYLTDPTRLDSLLSAITRHAERIARQMRHHDPEDAAQRVTIRVWADWKKFDRRGSFAGWVSRITRNLILDDYRSAEPVDQMDDKEDEQTLASVLPTLPDRHRDFDALPGQMRKIAAMLQLGYSKQETADAIGCSVRTLERIVEEHKTSLEAA